MNGISHSETIFYFFRLKRCQLRVHAHLESKGWEEILTNAFLDNKNHVLSSEGRRSTHYVVTGVNNSKKKERAGEAGRLRISAISTYVLEFSLFLFMGTLRLYQTWFPPPRRRKYHIYMWRRIVIFLHCDISLLHPSCPHTPYVWELLYGSDWCSCYVPATRYEIPCMRHTLSYPSEDTFTKPTSIPSENLSTTACVCNSRNESHGTICF